MKPDLTCLTTIAIACLPVSAALAQCVPAPGGLVSWLAGEGNIKDSIGANNGVLVNGAAFATGKVGQAFTFDGATGYVKIPRSPSLDVTNAFTIDFWMRADPGNIIGETYQGLVTSDFFGIEISMPFRRGIQVYASTNNGATWVHTIDYNGGVGALFASGEWHHIAGTYDGTKLQLYVDGQPSGNPAPMTGLISPMRPDGFLTIGSEDGRGEPGRYFKGQIDEVDIFNRALSASEIQAIYAAGGAGKCEPTGGLVINTQPASQTAYIGGSATFTVVATGQPPMSYQWRFNGVDLVEQTNSSLTIAPVQLGNAGNYSVTVADPAGSVISAAAVLTVLPREACVPPVSGMISWWSGEGDTLDRAGANSGRLVGGATFGTGRVGQAFSFNGAGQYVEMDNSPNLNPAGSFTVEAWIMPVQNSGWQVIMGKWGDESDAFNQRSYNFSMVPGGGLIFGISDEPNQWNTSLHHFITTNDVVKPNVWSHVAAVYQQSTGTRQIYVNGTMIAERRDPPISVLNSTSKVGIGARLVSSTSGSDYFMGLIDEVSFYAKALSDAEIRAIYAAGSAGKCLGSIPKNPPVVQTPPVNRTALAGSTVSFTVSVSGTPPFSYQWNHNGATISGATNESLTLANVQPGQAGTYLVRITNVVGSAEASATLTVNLPTAVVRAVNTSGNAGQTLSVPIVLPANGNENGIGFSLNFYPSQLTYQDVQLGSGAAGYSLVLNTNQAAAGRVGVLVSAPFGAAFAAGSQEVVRVLFLPPVSTNSRTATLSFADQPVVRQLSDAMGNTLPSTFLSGMLSIAPSQFEGDVAMRPNGDGKVTVADWVLIGRFAAKLDDTGPANGSEFQRADCAPRSTLGDGIISVTDWVQAGRYAANLDELTLAGGPEAPKPLGQASGGAGKLNVSREIRISDATIQQGDTANVTVSLQAQGDENAVGFSLYFDPAVFAFRGANRGSSAGSATVQINTNEVGRGSVAAMLALPPGSSFEAGERELLTVSLQSIASFDGTPVFALTDVPILREVSDVNASPLPTKYVSGTITVVPLPILKMDLLGAAVRLSWPASAVHFTLQESGELPASSSTWTNTVEPVQSADDELFVVLPLKDSARFYRLQRFSAP